MMKKRRILLNIVSFDFCSLSPNVQGDNVDILASLKHNSVRCTKIIKVVNFLPWCRGLKWAFGLASVTQLFT